MTDLHDPEYARRVFERRAAAARGERLEEPTRPTASLSPNLRAMGVMYLEEAAAKGYMPPGGMPTLYVGDPDAPGLTEWERADRVKAVERVNALPLTLAMAEMARVNRPPLASTVPRSPLDRAHIGPASKALPKKDAPPAQEEAPAPAVRSLTASPTACRAWLDERGLTRGPFAVRYAGPLQVTYSTTSTPEPGDWIVREGGHVARLQGDAAGVLGVVLNVSPLPATPEGRR